MIINHAFVFANGPLRPNPLVNTDMIGIFEELRDRGCDCGYVAVRRYARRWSKEREQSTAAA
jgi:hypothetical protein